MMVVLRLLYVAQPTDGLNHIVLWVALARIDHVVNRMHTAEMRMIGFTGLRRDPNLMPFGIAVEPAISEVFPQQPELPQVIRNVLADIGHGTVGTHNHLGVF